MTESTHAAIRHIFLTPRPHMALMTAAAWLGMSFGALKEDIAEGRIVAVLTGMGRRIAKEEMMAAAMRVWGQAAIEEALGEDAVWLLPEAIRMVVLRARVRWYQREVLRELARRDATTVDEVLMRELEDVVCAHAGELGARIPGLAGGMAWPECSA